MKIKVKMLKLAAGPKGVFLKGKEYTLPSNIAKPMVNGGYATEIKPVIKPKSRQAIERANRKAPEKATLKK